MEDTDVSVDADVSGSNFSALWNFEKLKGNENYKPWSRSCKNALQTMGIWSAITTDPPSKPFETVVKEVEGKTTSVTKTDVVYQQELTA